MTCNVVSGLANFLNAGILTALVGIITLLVLVFQTTIFRRQGNLMEIQARISELQTRVSEAVALSLEPTWANPWQLRVNAKNEGKGIAHQPRVGIKVYNSKGDIIYATSCVFQSLGSGSTQNAYAAIQDGVSTTADLKFVFDWSATSTDGQRYNGHYEIPIDEIETRERPKTKFA